MNLKTLGLEDSHVKCIMFMESMLAEFFSVEPHNGAPGAPTVLYMRDIFRTLHVRVRNLFEGHRFSVNI